MPTGADPELPPEFYSEHHQVDALLETNPPSQGVMFLIRNEGDFSPELDVVPSSTASCASARGRASYDLCHQSAT